MIKKKVFIDGKKNYINNAIKIYYNNDLTTGPITVLNNEYVNPPWGKVARIKV